MPEQKSSFLNEMLFAGRGVGGLIVGNRAAPSHFDVSQAGLVGSFIGLLLITGLSAALPLLLGFGGGRIFTTVVSGVIQYGLQIGFAAALLRQIGRSDGLVPYLVADNWASFYITLGTMLLAITGIGGQLMLIAIGILVIVVEVNIGRLVLKLPGLQIAMLIVAQLVGVLVAQLLIGILFPGLLPDLTAELAAAQ